MNKYKLMREQIDQKLKAWRQVNEKHPRPSVGWVKTLREALGMTAKQLAKRLNLKQSRIFQLENAEAEDAISLRTLRKVADAMDCELVYAIVPRKSSLEEILKDRAKAIAAANIAEVAHTMALENQALNREQLKKQELNLFRILFERSGKKLWTATLTDIKKSSKKKKFSKND